jgi:hypothetical protein
MFRRVYRISKILAGLGVVREEAALVESGGWVRELQILRRNVSLMRAAVIRHSYACKKIGCPEETGHPTETQVWV